MIFSKFFNAKLSLTQSCHVSAESQKALIADADDRSRQAAFVLPLELPRSPEEGLALAAELCAALEIEFRKYPERLRKLGPVSGEFIL